jgi:hypothetical protein
MTTASAIVFTVVRDGEKCYVRNRFMTALLYIVPLYCISTFWTGLQAFGRPSVFCFNFNFIFLELKIHILTPLC